MDVLAESVKAGDNWYVFYVGLAYLLFKVVIMWFITYKFMHMLTNGNKMIKIPATIAVVLSSFAIVEFSFFIIFGEAICLLLDYITRPKIKDKKTYRLLGFIGIILLSIIRLLITFKNYTYMALSVDTFDFGGLIASTYVFLPLVIWILLKNRNNYKLSHLIIGLLAYFVLIISIGLLVFFAWTNNSNVNDVEDFIYYITTLSNEQSKDNGISYLYGFMYNFIKPFVNIEGLDWSPAYTIVSVFPIPLIIGLWYLYKNNKHYEFMFPVIISIVITTILAVMGNRMPHIVNMFLGAELVSLSSIIFATGLLGLYMIFYLMSNSDEKLFSLKQAIWITMACLIFSAIVPLPTAIADRNWRTLFTVPYVILTFLMLNYNKDKKYQRWFVWSLAIITILETSVYLISGF